MSQSCWWWLESIAGVEGVRSRPKARANAGRCGQGCAGGLQSCTGWHDGGQVGCNLPTLTNSLRPGFGLCVQGWGELCTNATSVSSIDPLHIRVAERGRLGAIRRPLLCWLARSCSRGCSNVRLAVGSPGPDVSSVPPDHERRHASHTPGRCPFDMFSAGLVCCRSCNGTGGHRRPERTASGYYRCAGPTRASHRMAVLVPVTGALTASTLVWSMTPDTPCTSSSASTIVTAKITQSGLIHWPFG